jgi:tetratricopeptide (TPR) repeat protein
MSLDELRNLDVLHSMKGTIDAITAALDSLSASCAGTQDREVLDVVHMKLLEVDERFERPLESPETWVRLKGIAAKAGDRKLDAYCQEKLDLLEANRLHSEGYLWLFYGDCVKAADYLRKAVKLAPGHPLAGKDLETAESRLEKAKDEIAKAEAQIGKNPGNAKAWLKKANALVTMGRVDEALPVFDKAISLDPRDPDALAKKGAALEGMGKFTEAVDLFNRAVAIKPTSRTANKGLALAEYFLDGGT